MWGQTKVGARVHQDGWGGEGGYFGVGEVWEVDWDITRVVGYFGGGDLRSERFRALKDIDMAPAGIERVGDLRNPNYQGSKT